MLGNFRLMLAALHRCCDRLGIGMVDMPVADLRHRRRVAAPHAGRADDTHIVAEFAGEGFEQRVAAGQGAAQAVADPDRDGRRRVFAVEDDVEVGVKRCDLVHLSHRQPAGVRHSGIRTRPA